MKRSGSNTSQYLSVGVAALFLTGFLLLVVFGARSYRGIVESQYGNMDGRSLTAYIVSSVKANDTRGAVGVEESEYGQVLTVTDGDSGYAMRYYRYNGQLVEDFARAGAPLAPGDSQAIAPTDVFTVESDGGLLIVTTDAGRTLLYLHGGEEDEP